MPDRCALPKEEKEKNNVLMQLIEPSRDREGGNTHKPLPSRKQTHQRIHHFFTFNNYDRSDIAILLKVFNEFCYSYAFQEECVSTPHLQGIVSCKRKMRDTEFGLPRAIHWEKPEHVPKAYEYCTDVKKRTGDVWTKNYEIPYTFYLTEFKSWQSEILNIIKSEADCRTINWYWSNLGNVGKSSFVKHLICNHNAILLTKGKFSDICNLIYKANMSLGAIVIFDLPRNNGNKISYDALESIKNGMISNTKYETGFKVFKPPHVFVFANEEPEYCKLSSDRWNVVEL